MRTGLKNANDLVEQPALRVCLPPLDGVDVLELGCGMGQLSRYLARSGAADVLAVDSSRLMIEAARAEIGYSQIRYLVGAMEGLDQPPASFDLVVSSLAIHYVKDHGRLINDVARWLRPGGYLVFSVEHPMKSAPEQPDVRWCLDAADQPIWPLSGYCAEGEREREWLSSRVVRYHRKVSTILNDVVNAGLILEYVDEPATSPAGDFFEHHRERPAILLIRARKGGSGCA